MRLPPAGQPLPDWHPFEAGDGRLGRALSEKVLSQALVPKGWIFDHAGETTVYLRTAPMTALCKALNQ